MGCKYCTSGLGKNCQGPLGLDDLEVGCDCDCHKCNDCGSAYCKNMGGPDPCESECEDDSDEDYWEYNARVNNGNPKPVSEGTAGQSKGV